MQIMFGRKMRIYIIVIERSSHNFSNRPFTYVDDESETERLCADDVDHGEGENMSVESITSNENVQPRAASSPQSES